MRSTMANKTQAETRAGAPLATLHVGLDFGGDADSDRLLRLKAVLALLPISKSAWWQGIRSGIYPAPVKIGIRSVAWRYCDIKRLLDAGIPLNVERAR